MRSNTIFFIIGLIVLANTTSMEQEFAQIESHPLGQTMLDLVQINMQANSEAGMQTNDQFDQINDLIAELKTSMTQDKKSFDNEHVEFQAAISQLIDSTNQTLLQQRALRVSVQNNLRQNQKNLDASEADLNEARSHLASVKNSIVQADRENVRARAAYEVKEHDLDEAVRACKEAVLELAKLNVAHTMIQMDQVQAGMAKVQKTVALHLPQRSMIINPIILALVDMGTNASPKLLAKVNGLINQLRSSLESELKDTRVFENKRNGQYQHDRTDLKEDQLATENRIGRDISQVVNYQSQISANQRILNGLNAAIPANEKTLSIKQNERIDEQQKYNIDNGIRVGELTIMSKLQAYLVKNADKVSKYLRSRIETVSHRKF